MHDPASLILHSHPLVLVSLVVSCFAVMISLFNFVMFQLNEFNPNIIERELFKRRDLAARNQDDSKVGDSKKRFYESRSHLKRAFSSVNNGSRRRRIVQTNDLVEIPGSSEDRASV